MTFDKCTLNQGFAENANDAYKLIKGHPGQDTACGYGSIIYSPVSGKVSALYTPERPASDGFVAVYILVQTKLEIFEFAIGHCSEVMVALGQTIIKGQPIAKEGNKGLVYAGDTKITLAMQAAGDKRGSHRHSQKRPVLEVFKRQSSKHYLQNAKGYLRTEKNGYYEYALPYADYASCVNFALPLFTETLKKGMKSYQVLLLQRAIGAPKELQTGTFGDYTETKLLSFQLANGMEPVGQVGPKTRIFLNERYGQFEDPINAPPAAVVPVTKTDILTAAEKALEATPEPAKDAWSVILRGLRDLLK